MHFKSVLTGLINFPIPYVCPGMFVALGMSAVIPVTHYVAKIGPYRAYNVGNIGWLALMAVLYISGAVLYAVRIPERLFPGKFDIWVSELKTVEAIYWKATKKIIFHFHVRKTNVIFFTFIIF